MVKIVKLGIKRPVTRPLLRDPEPREVKYTFISVDDHLMEPPDTFEGRMPRKFEAQAPRVVETEGVAKLRVFLDPKLVDAEKKVTIVVDGKTVHQGKVASSIETALDSWRDREDSRLVFDRAVLIDVATASVTTPTVTSGDETDPEPATPATKPGKKKLVLY